MKCENVPKAVKKPPVLCTTLKTTFSRCRQMEDGGNYQFAHAQHEKFCQFNFRLPSCVDTVLNLKVSTVMQQKRHEKLVLIEISNLAGRTEQYGPLI